jgi:tRNA(Ile2) C34 agmatinyltransferase TiaS
MELVSCQAKDAAGHVVAAHKAVCPDCKGDKFMILVFNGHNHLQCTKCNTSFCQGGCHAPQPSIPKCPACNGEQELNGRGGYACFFCGHEQ